MRQRLSLTLVTCALAALIAVSCGTDSEPQGADAAADAGSDVDSAADGGQDALADADADANGSEDADVGADVSDGSHCFALDQASCEADPICYSLYGKPIPPGVKRFAGCRTDCLGSQVLTCALDMDGGCWIFPDTCVPEGWQKVWECEPAKCVGAFDAGPW